MSSELYKPYRSISIKGRDLKSVEGVKVPQDHPFRMGPIPAFSRVSINPGTELWIRASFQGRAWNRKLIKISPDHGRSYELNFGKTKNIFWEDKYGNLYSTITTKGNSLMFPSVQEADNLPYGLYIHGLQDGSLVARPLRASKILRANQIDTEMILKVIEPQELPFYDSLVPISDPRKDLDFKRGLIWLFSTGRETRNATLPSMEEIRDVEAKLKDMRFLITIRGLQVSERFQDLMRCETRDEFMAMMERVFTFVNMAERRRSKGDFSHKADYFSEQAQSDVDRYVAQYLPQKLATNFAKLHNLGLVHKYPHAGNVSAAGGIYDLDSVWGESLGDKPVKNINKAQDIDTLIDGDSNSLGIGTVLTELVRKRFIPAIGNEFFANFVDAYNETAVDSSPIDECESLEFLRVLKRVS